MTKKRQEFQGTAIINMVLANWTLVSGAYSSRVIVAALFLTHLQLREAQVCQDRHQHSYLKAVPGNHQ
jgi:hypothetical protein